MDQVSVEEGASHCCLSMVLGGCLQVTQPASHTLVKATEHPGTVGDIPKYNEHNSATPSWEKPTLFGG